LFDGFEEVKGTEGTGVLIQSTLKLKNKIDAHLIAIAPSENSHLLGLF
jgi:hypothetical protein